MKRLICALALLCALSTSISAGDTQLPGKTDPPPPCTENCSATAANEDEATVIPLDLIEIVLTLLAVR